MKKYIKSFCIFCLLSSSTLAEVRVSPAVEVEKGIIEKTTFIADKAGQVFLEFLEGTRVFNYQDKGAFEGSVLPPTLQDIPIVSPLPRMQEVLTFKLEGSTESPLVFMDKIQMMSSKELYRLEHYSPESFERTARIKVFVPVDSSRKKLSLWEYVETEEWSGTREDYEREEASIKEGRSEKRQEVEFGPDNPEPGRISAWDKLFRSKDSLVEVYRSGWVKVGGRLEETDEESKKVFIAHIKNTGIYTLFDEFPSPSPVAAVDPSGIELAQEPPFRDAFTDPTQNLNEAGLFDADTLEQVPIDTTFDPDAIPDEPAFRESAPEGTGQKTVSLDPSSDQPLIPSVDGDILAENAEMENEIPAVSQPPSPTMGPPPQIPIFTSYVVCEPSTSMLARLPGAARTIRPAFLDPARTTPLTPQEVERIPDGCYVFYPPQVLEAFPKAEFNENGTLKAVAIENTNLSEEPKPENQTPDENLQPPPSEGESLEESPEIPFEDDNQNLENNTSSSSEEMNLEASVGNYNLPQTGIASKKSASFPWAFLFALGVLGAGMYLAFFKKPPSV